MANQPNHDYSTGEPRRHHELYIEDGNLVIQVEKGIFNVHRSIMAKYSPTIKDLLEESNRETNRAGTNERPLVFSGDKAIGWELLLGLQYDSPRAGGDRLSGEKLLTILPIAHKYRMENVEAELIKGLKKTSTYNDSIDLAVASMIIKSDELLSDAIARIVKTGTIPTMEQAQRMGLEVTHNIMNQINQALINASRNRWN